MVALLTLGGYWLLSRPTPVGAAPAASEAPAGHVAQTAPAGLSGDGPTQAPGSSSTSADAAAKMRGSANGSLALANSPTDATSAVASPLPTRSLDPPPTFQIEDRKWAVLGTRATPQRDSKNSQNSARTVLVLRDEASGQLDYRQSALRFVLHPGTDYEAFIRERRNAQRMFVNTMYGDISVDPAYIAAEYTALVSDKRVVKVEFIPLAVSTQSR